LSKQVMFKTLRLLTHQNLRPLPNTITILERIELPQVKELNTVREITYFKSHRSVTFPNHSVAVIFLLLLLMEARASKTSFPTMEVLLKREASHLDNRTA